MTGGNSSSVSLPPASQLLDVQRQIAEQKQRLEQQNLKSPIEGRVFDIAVNKGSLATPSQVSVKVVA